METDATACQIEQGGRLVPRPVVIVVVFAILIFLGADFAAQFIVPGHTASPVIDGALVALLGAILTGAKGPRPAAPDKPDPTADSPTPGRHRGEETP